jgi:uncharacterized protein (DUF433 family)
VPKHALVSDSADALTNILPFESAVSRSQDLRDRLAYFRAWYATPVGERNWAFAPSKWVGYPKMSASKYLAIAKIEGPADGRETEHRLKKWFVAADPASPLGRELHERLAAFFQRWNAQPNKLARISILKSELNRHPARSGAGASEALMNRISSDPRICAGRPCIKGTRMRVTDILDMLAAGESGATILKDFPYLAKEDIAAALAYAARASAHRVIEAA